MKNNLRRIHRWLSVILAIFWLLQGLTGALLVFQGELDQASIDRETHPLDVAALGRAIAEAQADNPDRRIPYVYASRGNPDRFDIYLVDGEGKSRIRHVDGDGAVLRERPSNHDFLNAGILKIAHTWHETMFAGEWSAWLVGTSGFLLLTNLILGLKLAWPQAGRWGRALAPAKAKGGAAKAYGWHRALGLWLGIPAILIVTTGILQVWGGPLYDWLGPVSASPTVTRTGDPAAVPVSPDAAIETALARYPGARLSILTMPRADAYWYRVTIRQPEEPRRIFGTTQVYVDAANGQILADHDALKEGPGPAFLNAIYPIHTGEYVGTIGRVIVLVIAIWLVSMVCLGIYLWRARAAMRR